jgi:hypothetical protein
MFGKVKKWLGIEGVKLELLLPEEIFEKEGVVEGGMRFQSMNPQTVTEVKVVLIERYSRGRGAEKLIDEYELGSIVLRQNIEVPANEPVEIDFTLPFSIPRSDMDQFGKRNFLFGGLAKVAKMTRAVKSEYRIEAEASVKGVALNPFDKKAILIK